MPPESPGSPAPKRCGCPRPEPPRSGGRRSPPDRRAGRIPLSPEPPLPARPPEPVRAVRRRGPPPARAPSHPEGRGRRRLPVQRSGWRRRAHPLHSHGSPNRPRARVPGRGPHRRPARQGSAIRPGSSGERAGGPGPPPPGSAPSPGRTAPPERGSHRSPGARLPSETGPHRPPGTPCRTPDAPPAPAAPPRAAGRPGPGSSAPAHLHMSAYRRSPPSPALCLLRRSF